MYVYTHVHVYKIQDTTMYVVMCSTHTGCITFSCSMMMYCMMRCMMNEWYSNVVHVHVVHMYRVPGTCMWYRVLGIFNCVQY
jgi:hypothetical protein